MLHMSITSRAKRVSKTKWYLRHFPHPSLKQQKNAKLKALQTREKQIPERPSSNDPTAQNNSRPANPASKPAYKQRSFGAYLLVYFSNTSWGMLGCKIKCYAGIGTYTHKPTWCEYFYFEEPWGTRPLTNQQFPSLESYWPNLSISPPTPGTHLLTTTLTSTSLQK